MLNSRDEQGLFGDLTGQASGPAAIRGSAIGLLELRRPAHFPLERAVRGAHVVGVLRPAREQGLDESRGRGIVGGPTAKRDLRRAAPVRHRSCLQPNEVPPERVCVLVLVETGRAPEGRANVDAVVERLEELAQIACEVDTGEGGNPERHARPGRPDSAMSLAAVAGSGASSFRWRSGRASGTVTPIAGEVRRQHLAGRASYVFPSLYPHDLVPSSATQSAPSPRSSNGGRLVSRAG